MFEGRNIDHRSSKVDTSITDLRRSTRRSSIFEGRHIDLRRSTYRYPKVDTSIFERRHIVTSIVDLRWATHRSSKVATSIFEDRRRKHHTYNSSPNIVHNCAPISPWSRRSYTRSYVRTCIITATVPHVH